MNFSDAEEKQLINIISEHPVLYDASHEDYRNIAVTYKVWNDIGKKLNKHSEHCKKKWKHIRDSYIRFKKKHKSLNGSYAKQSKFKRHHKLSFLEGIPISHEKTGDTSAPGSPQEDADNDSHTLEEQEDSTKGAFQIVDFDIVDEDEQDSSNDADQNESSDGMDPNSREELVKRRYSEDAQERDERILVKKRKDDDVDFFCRHIAEVLRSLPPVDKAEAKKHLFAVLSEYEIMAAKHLSGLNYLK